MEKIYIQPIEHKGEERIALRYRYRPGNDIDRTVRGLRGARFSGSRKCWHIPYRKDYESYLIDEFLPVDNVRLTFLKSEEIRQKAKEAKRSSNHPDQSGKMVTKDNDSPKTKSSGENTIRQKGKKEPGRDKPINDRLKKVLQVYVDTMRLKRLSTTTQKTYYCFFQGFVESFPDKDVSEFDYRSIYNYIKVKADGLNLTQKKQLMAAIKFYYEKALGRNKDRKSVV